ncbi:thioredoxin-like protein [Stereum hirsutum FP-91666 SS1]|uniref:thioredoxin-like protein n=1 Tax=Stereum hirsutum (strain FP-91666) TaxID=721885 RepID=UPI00044492F8|nr:thioredoxin-like protein [Stereum hirsutum FP-91666 SS1]EIM83837.1 thioredoxin-like protein [Stereum hirsutum FP-91666 SS1]
MSSSVMNIIMRRSDTYGARGRTPIAQLRSRIGQGLSVKLTDPSRSLCLASHHLHARLDKDSHRYRYPSLNSRFISSDKPGLASAASLNSKLRAFTTTTIKAMSNPVVTEENPAGLKPIDIGDTLPTLVLRNEKDEEFDVSTVAKTKGAIIFLVPKVNTGGCTIQACGFRDSYPQYTGIDYEIYCLSADPPSEQTSWQSDQKLPYPLISDPDRILINALGAGEGGKTNRSHFIFEKGTGKLIDKKIPVTPTDSPKLALEFIKKYESSKSSL